MCALIVSALILSTIGALCQRALAAALGVPARLVLGLGPRLGDKDAPPRALELRPVLVWAWTPLEGGTRGRRAAVRAIGPLAILLVPFAVLVTALFAHGVPDETPAERMVVGAVIPDGPAERAGIRPGDVIVSVEGAPVASTDDIVRELERHGGDRPVHVVRDRAGAREELELAPAHVGGRPRIGVTAEVRMRDIGVGEAIAAGASLVARQLAVVVETFVPREREVTGPVGMVRAAAGAPRPSRWAVVAALAAAWTSLAVIWSAAAAIAEIVRAVRGRP